MRWYFRSALFQSSEFFLFVRLFCVIRRYGAFVSLFRAFSWFVPYVNEIEINK